MAHTYEQFSWFRLRELWSDSGIPHRYCPNNIEQSVYLISIFSFSSIPYPFHIAQQTETRWNQLLIRFLSSICCNLYQLILYGRFDRTTDPVSLPTAGLFNCKRVFFTHLLYNHCVGSSCSTGKHKLPISCITFTIMGLSGIILGLFTFRFTFY